MLGTDDVAEELGEGLFFKKAYKLKKQRYLYDYWIHECFEIYLAELEKHHNMSSDIFYDKFNTGELGDNSEYIKWYAYKDTHNKLMDRAKEIEKIKIYW